MKLAYTLYHLPWKEQLGGIDGFLLFIIDGEHWGVGNYHAWSRHDLNMALQELKAGVVSPVMERTLFFAKLDLEARKKNQSLYSSKHAPRSNALIIDGFWKSSHAVDYLVSHGFQTIKLKLTDSLNDLMALKEVFLRFPSIKFRLDYQQALTEEMAEKHLTALMPHKAQIDYIEDITLFNAYLWSHLQKQFSLPLASDAQSNQHLHNDPLAFIWIYKPALTSAEPYIKALKHGARVVVTSYLDHPVGQAGAIWTSQELNRLFPERRETDGLATHLLFQTNEFSVDFGVISPQFSLPQGAGWGWKNPIDRMLENADTLELELP